MPEHKPLATEELTWRCDPALFPFTTTADLPSIEEIIGQQRALESIDFGLGITNHNYNVYVLGSGGTGKLTTVKSVLEKKAAEGQVPDDWCYLNDFKDAERPRAMRLPPGRGSDLRSAMSILVGSLRRDIPRVFDSKDYEKHRDEILEGQQEFTKTIFQRLENAAAKRGVMLKKTVSGLVVVPAKDGKPIKQEEFEALEKGEREKFEASIKTIQDKLSDAVREARDVDKETQKRVKDLDREVVQYVVNPHINELLEEFKELDSVVEYLTQVRDDILENIDDFRPQDEVVIPGIPGMKMQRGEPGFERYRVNLIVNNKETKGAPVVFENNPTFSNLFGRLEFKVQFGVGVTDFSMIKGGSAHKANGGYLVINAMDMLKNIFVYDSLKRMIKNREVRIEDVWEQYRPVSTSTLKPEPIPVDIKLVIIGDAYLYYLLYNLDPEYRKLFKVKADFDVLMPRDDGNIQKYASFIATRCKENDLLPFDPGGTARVVEYGLRLSGDREKLSARFNEIEDLVVESSYWASELDASVVTAVHVERAVQEKIYRTARIKDRLREYITDDVIMVSTDGAVVGQVNGIAVLDPGDYAFGKPSRITAKTFMGDTGVVNLEREAKMSGKIHNKALMILTSFLGERYAQDFPLTLSASVCFEQLYDEIEGDSATCTEVYALLSSLSGLPLKQGIAITGSMNQLGEVQPIGGVNVKIEGFFDVCRDKGLTGTQGVIIPRRNVRNLMLKGEVRDAVAEGKFAVYPIDFVDEGFEILTGVLAGEKRDDGSYSEGTSNRAIHDRLRSLATRYKAFGRPKKPALKSSQSANNNNNDSGGPGGGGGKSPREGWGGGYYFAGAGGRGAGVCVGIGVWWRYGSPIAWWR
jgi:lon-related putative ATP-dependent protease